MATVPDLTPRQVPTVQTKYRRIVTPIPAPETVATLETLLRCEPRAMSGLPPILWDRALGFQVFDKAGNMWIDWSSGVLVASAGHSHPRIVEAIVNQAQHGLLHNYCFPNEPRARLVERLSELMPEPLKRIFLLTTGSESCEAAIKLCRSYGVKTGGRSKHVIVSYEKAFHGRTMGSQQAGGTPALKEWIVNIDKGFVQVPFPDGYRTPDTTFDSFLRALDTAGVQAQDVAGVILETFQGATAALAPVSYMRQMRDWCTRNGALLVCDEVQAGFGRSGKLWGFEHYGIVPDLACFGKGISGSLPLAAVAGPAHIMDLHPPGSMSSTHSGNPICSAAALASVEVILGEGLVENAARVGGLLQRALREMAPRFPHFGNVDGVGLVAAINVVKPGTKDPDPAMAWDIIRRCMEKGLLLFSPVGYMGGTVKICPPLSITEEAMIESLSVLNQAFQEAEAAVEEAVAAR